MTDAARSGTDDGAFEGVIGEADRRPDLERARRPGEGGPDALGRNGRLLAKEQHLDVAVRRERPNAVGRGRANAVGPGAPSAPLAPHHSKKTRGNHPGVVHDQEITGPKKSGELAESVVRHRAAGSIE
jgi:hypothetical protein